MKENSEREFWFVLALNLITAFIIEPFLIASAWNYALVGMFPMLPLMRFWNALWLRVGCAILKSGITFVPQHNFKKRKEEKNTHA